MLFCELGWDTHCNDIEESHQGRHDSSCNDHAPHWQTQILHAGSTLVEIAQNVKTQHDHGHAEEDETAFGTEHGPVAREVRAEERAFGYDEEETNGTCDEVRYSVEEKELEDLLAKVWKGEDGAFCLHWMF